MPSLGFGLRVIGSGLGFGPRFKVVGSGLCD